MTSAQAIPCAWKNHQEFCPSTSLKSPWTFRTCSAKMLHQGSSLRGRSKHSTTRETSLKRHKSRAIQMMIWWLLRVFFVRVSFFCFDLALDHFYFYLNARHRGKKVTCHMPMIGLEFPENFFQDTAIMCIAVVVSGYWKPCTMVSFTQTWWPVANHRHQPSRLASVLV